MVRALPSIQSFTERKPPVGTRLRLGENGPALDGCRGNHAADPRRSRRRDPVVRHSECLWRYIGNFQPSRIGREHRLSVRTQWSGAFRQNAEGNTTTHERPGDTNVGERDCIARIKRVWFCPEYVHFGCVQPMSCHAVGFHSFAYGRGPCCYGNCVKLRAPYSRGHAWCERRSVELIKGVSLFCCVRRREALSTETARSHSRVLRRALAR